MLKLPKFFHVPVWSQIARKEADVRANGMQGTVMDHHDGTRVPLSVRDAPATHVVIFDTKAG